MRGDDLAGVELSVGARWEMEKLPAGDRLVIAFGFLTLAAWAMRGVPLPTDATPYAWGWLAVSGLVGFVFGDLCLFRSYVLIGPRLGMLVMSLAPPLTTVIGWLILGETLSGRDLVGMTLTVCGIGWAVLERAPASAVSAARPSLADAEPCDLAVIAVPATPARRTALAARPLAPRRRRAALATSRRATSRRRPGWASPRRGACRRVARGRFHSGSEMERSQIVRPEWPARARTGCRHRGTRCPWATND